MTGRAHHLTVNGSPWCDWTGCKAGQDINAKAGDIRCGQPSGAQARKSAAALRPFFKPGAVRVVAGPCPSSEPRAYLWQDGDGWRWDDAEDHGNGYGTPLHHTRAEALESIWACFNVEPGSFIIGDGPPPYYPSEA